MNYRINKKRNAHSHNRLMVITAIQKTQLLYGYASSKKYIMEMLHRWHYSLTDRNLKKIIRELKAEKKIEVYERARVKLESFHEVGGVKYPDLDYFGNIAFYKMTDGYIREQAEEEVWNQKVSRLIDRSEIRKMFPRAEYMSFEEFKKLS